MSLVDILNVTVADWMEDGACRQSDPELFHPDKGRADMVRQAKSICAECPVATQCLQWALDNHEPHGVWGGYTERERRVLRHIVPVTRPDRRKTHCRNNHEYTPENTYVRPDGNRECRTCRNARHMRHERKSA